MTNEKRPAPLHQVGTESIQTGTAGLSGLRNFSEAGAITFVQAPPALVCVTVFRRLLCLS
jgi:hypothetical protein